MAKKEQPLVGLAALGGAMRTFPSHNRAERDAAEADSLNLATTYLERTIAHLKQRLANRYATDRDDDGHTEQIELYDDEMEAGIKESLSSYEAELQELKTEGKMSNPARQQKYAQEALRPSPPPIFPRTTLRRRS